MRITTSIVDAHAVGESNTYSTLVNNAKLIQYHTESDVIQYIKFIGIEMMISKALYNVGIAKKRTSEIT